MDVKETLTNFGLALIKDPILVLILILVVAKLADVF